MRARFKTMFLLLAFAFGLNPANDLLAFSSGKGQIDVLIQDIPMTVFTYRPQDCERPTLLFVFHGLGRKASKMRNNAIKLAERTCLLVLAPFFDRERFPNWRYHRAGVVKKGRVQPRDRWTEPIVDELINWGRHWTGDPRIPYMLFGHSAGGQFLSRLSAYSAPAGAKRIVVANPSVHVMPSLSEQAPYGMAGVYDKDEASDNLRAYLALPLTIYLGDRDIGEKNLVKNEMARRQGEHRLARGRKAYEAARSLAESKSWPFHWRLVIAPGIGHSSKGMLNAPIAPWAFGLKGHS